MIEEFNLTNDNQLYFHFPSSKKIDEASFLFIDQQKLNDSNYSNKLTVLNNKINISEISFSEFLELPLLSSNNENYNDDDKIYNLDNPKLTMNKKRNNNLNSTNEQSKKKIKEYLVKTNDKNTIFKIAKFNKNTNRGRIKKYTFYRVMHTKFAEDNIIRKVKINFIEACRIYINYLYKDYLKKSNMTFLLLQKINPRQLYIIRKSVNLNWFNLKLKDVFSEQISKKFKRSDKDLNKYNIIKVMNENKATEVINVLNTTVKDIYKDYVENKKKEGFKTLDDDLMRIKSKMIKENEEKDIEKYLYRYKVIAKNLERIFISKIPRVNKIKKNKK